MATGTRVKINTASADEIQQALYRVGRATAQDIIDLRSRSGPFRGPDDLARVRGISARQAQTLSHHIDWSVPEVALVRKVWTGITAVLVTIFCILVGVVPSRAALEEVRRPGGPDEWELWIYGFGVAATASGVVWGAANAVRFLSTRRERAEKGARVAARAALALAMAILVGTTGLIALAAKHWPGGAGAFLRSSNTWLIISTTVMLVLMIAPGLIVRWRPRWARKPWVENLHNAATAMAALVFLWASWVTRAYQPWWMRSAYLLLGAYLAYRSARIMGGRSYFDPATYAAIPGTRPADDTDRLLHWLNESLPDPQEQEVLWRGLARQRRPGRLRTGITHALYVIASWVLLNSAAAILEQYVQDHWKAAACRHTGLLCGERRAIPPQAEVPAPLAPPSPSPAPS